MDDFHFEFNAKYLVVFCLGLFCQREYNTIQFNVKQLVYLCALFNPEVFCKLKVG